MYADAREALRYLGIHAPDEAQLEQAQRCITQLESNVKPRFVWRRFPLQYINDAFFLSGTQVILSGHTAEMMLSECQSAVLLAATLGPLFDSMLRTVSARDMADALLLDGCGSSLVETGCNKAEKEISAAMPDSFLTDRFSPGYGDLPLSLQPSILSAINAGPRLGITLTDSFLMNPSKSVTAVIGISDQPQKARIRGCAFCSMKETCMLRKGGQHCG